MHGIEARVLHADAWKIFKSIGSESGGSGISTGLKKAIFEEALRDRQNVIIPDCGTLANLLSMCSTRGTPSR
jgi:hypothetical protein